MPRQVTVRVPRKVFEEEVPGAAYTSTKVGVILRSHIEQMEALERALPEILARNEVRAENDSLPAGGDGGPRGSDHSDPTSYAATSRTPEDPVNDHVVALVQLIIAGSMIGQRMEQRVRLLRVMGEDARMRQPVGKDCLACGRYVANSESDRLHGGDCGTCAVAWLRFSRENPHVDRATWRLRRRHDDEEAVA